MNLVEAVRRAIIREEANARRRKQRNRLQKLIRKHFFGQNKNRINLRYVIKMVTMQEKLKCIFKDDMRNLGQYDQMGLNLWTNDFLEKKKKYLKKKDLPEGFSISFNVN